MFLWPFRARVAMGVVLASAATPSLSRLHHQSPSVAAVGVATATYAAPAQSGVDSTILKAFRWRSIGPDRGGRSIAVSGSRGRPKEGYFGATGGGLWKTTDGGESWRPVTDGQLTSASVGAVAVSETNPDIVFIGMGEEAIRGNIMPGDGVYKSTDAGKTWTHVGFQAAENISRIRIDPRNPDVVFVAAFGKYSAPNEERGIFKSTDGGRTWRKVLYRDPKTAGADISIDPRNPNVMYAALWEAYRLEYQMSSGGPGSGLFKSTDAGETWTEITRNAGLPSGTDGKIGVAVSGADPNRLYALVENENGGLFRSDDAGATWTLVNSGRNIRQRAFYYTRVAADPKNKDLVYAMNVGTFRSTDGGKTMVNFAGGDSHDLWIDPDNTDHVLHASDGGGAVTFNASAPAAQRTWSSRAYPTGQFYHVVTTGHVPYHVCGAQQDASTACVPSRAAGGRVGGGGGGRGAADFYAVGGAEPGYIAPDPRDVDVFFAGGNNGSFLTRLDRRSGELREVGPYPRMFSGESSSEVRERWQWTYPIVFSPADPRVLYASSQHVWKTTDGGQTWQRISPDLTRHDPKTMGPSGGPITHDMNGPEIYAMVFALAPSRKSTNILWAGSDDGLIQVTRNGGASWTNVTPSTMPDLGRVSIIDASPNDSASAYVAVKRPLLDDLSPYIFRTHDFGKTWTKIVDGIAPDDYVHAVREDPARRGLLYAATQHGLYLSYDDGDHWQSLRLNLPDLPVSDLMVRDNDLVISTMGRGFYVLDDVEPLRQYTPALASSPEDVLFAPAAAFHSGPGASIRYWLKHPAQHVRIDILDARGRLVRAMPDTGSEAGGRGGRGGRAGGAGAAADTTQSAEGEAGGGRRGGGAGGPPPKTVGLHAVPWDLRHDGATSFPGMVLWGGTTAGPEATPGKYSVRLTVDGKTFSQPIVVKRNPMHADIPDADLQAQLGLAIQIRDKVSDANNAVIQVRDVKQQVADRLKRSSDAQLKTAGDRLTQRLSDVEEAIYQVKNQSGQDPLNFPIKINNRLASLLRVVTTGDGKPIAVAFPIFKDLSTELKVQTDRLQQVLGTDLPAFNTEARRAGVDPVLAKKGPIA